VDVPEGTLIPPTDFIGVDFGVVNLATDSLGRKAGNVKRSGKRPKNIKRKLKPLSGKERRFKANENHRMFVEQVPFFSIGK
jgi:putative transposase